MEKKILKHLSKLTNEEFLKLFQIARGCYFDNYSIENVMRWSSFDIMVTVGYMKILFGVVECENDVRLGIGYSFIMKEYLSKDKISVSEEGIKEEKEDFTEENMVLVKNQNILFYQLECMGYM